MADERVKMRLEILTKEAETNPNMEAPSLTVMDVAEKGTENYIFEIIIQMGTFIKRLSFVTCVNNVTIGDWC